MRPGAWSGPLQLINVGSPEAKAAIVGLQPHLTQRDYRSGEHFARAIDQAVLDLAAAGGISGATVLVLPAQVGMFLALAGEWEEVYRAPSIMRAGLMAFADEKAGRLLLPALRGEARIYWPYALGRDLVRRKAAAICETLNQSVGMIAERHGVMVVAGTTVLPGPTVQDGELRFRPDMPLEEVAPIYGPNGRAFTYATARQTTLESAWEIEPGTGPVVIHNPALGEMVVAIGNDVDDVSDHLPAANPLAANSPRATRSGLGVGPRLAGNLWDWPTVSQIETWPNGSHVNPQAGQTFAVRHAYKVTRP